MQAAGPASQVEVAEPATFFLPDADAQRRLRCGFGQISWSRAVEMVGGRGGCMRKKSSSFMAKRCQGDSYRILVFSEPK